MTKEEQAISYRLQYYPDGGDYNCDDVDEAFCSGYEAAIRDRDTDIKEAMKRAVKEILKEIKK